MSSFQDKKASGLRRGRWVGGASALALLSGGALPAMAQDGGTQAVIALEEIIVSARRYDENLQDAPMSMAAMNSGYLEDQGIDTVKDVVEFTPGATFIRFNKAQNEYSMRGINSQGEGSSGDASVQTVIDNVVISKDFMKNPEMFDVERVEVLRGPQGTSFGRNASAGLIHIITKRPTQEFSAGATADVGSNESYGFEGYINTPVSDQLAARIAVNYDTNDGYTKDTSSGEGLDGQENFSIRGSLLFEPSDSFSLYFKAEYNEDNDEGPVRRSRDCTAPTLNPAAGPPHPNFGLVYTDPCNVWRTEISEGFDFFLDRETTNLTAEMVWDVNEDVSLTSVTGYLDGKVDYLFDASGTPINVLFQEVHNNASSFSQELRLDNQASASRLRWLGGLYFLTDEQDRFDENQFFQTSPGGTAPAGRRDTRDTKVSRNETTSFGVFGEVTLDITEKLNATVGGRWSRDEKDYQVAHTGFGFGGPIAFFDNCNFVPGPPQSPGANCGSALAPVGFATPVEVSDSWENLSLRASLQYAINDDQMAYALFSQGYKTGGFQNEPANEVAAATPFGKETADNYEIGYKAEFNQQVRLNISAFFINYDDPQLSQFISIADEDGNVLGFTQLTTNAGKIESKGVEIESTWQVTADFRLTGSFSFLNTEFKNTFLALDDSGTPTNLSGTRPDNSPTWTATVVGEYDFHLPDESILTLRGDWRGRSNAFDDVGELRSETVFQENRLRPSISMFGARASWTSASGVFSGSIWGRNLTNEKDVLNIGPSQPNTLQLPVAFAPPRTYGLTLGVNF